MHANRNRRKVKLSERYCSCLQWQQYGIPCLHAITAARKVGRLNDIMQWYSDSVEPCYYSVNYERALASAQVELPDIGALLADGTTLPAQWVAHPAGRPRTRRIRSRGEEGGSAPKARVCGRCGNLGHHDRRTCTAAPEWLQVKFLKLRWAVMPGGVRAWARRF